MTAAVVPLKLQVGARTLFAIPRRLRRGSLSLDDALLGNAPTLPPLSPGEDGYLVTSLPEVAVDAVMARGLLFHIRQRYRRYHVDLTVGAEAWEAGLAGSVRSALRRKAKRLAGLAGGAVEIRRYRTPDEVAAFHPLARTVSAATYQERLLGAGLPVDAASLQAFAAGDRLRAWLLLAGGAPIAYLCCTADGATLRYDHVGHDPRWNEGSPGTVLQAEALRDLFADRFARFDFTEGEGQHKRQFATGSIACVDLLLLRPTLANRGAVIAMRGFDRLVAWGKSTPALRGLGRHLRR